MENYREKKLKFVSKICRRAREKYNINRKKMAIICGYSVSNIQHFEDGVNNNALILLDYMKMLDVEEILDIVWREI